MIGLALACGGAAALNHYYDRDIDKLMGSRTAGRPVASGRVSPERALEFGIALSALSFVLLDSLVNLPTALLALAGNLFYVLVYTRWLKRSTPQNIVIGGAAGAVPPLVGYAAATGASRLGGARDVRDRLPLDAAALLGARADDPRALRERERPDAAGRRAATARPPARSLWYTAALVVATLVPGRLRRLRARLRRLGARCSGSLFAWLRRRALAADDAARRRCKLFHFSMLYLALLFVAMALDAVV